MFKEISCICATESGEKCVYWHTDDATAATAAFTVENRDIISPAALCVCVCVC